MNHSETDEPVNSDAAIDWTGLPDTVSNGSAICIAKPAPLTDYALPLRVVDRYADSSACRIIVTPAVEADETIRQHDAMSSSADSRLGIIDLTGDEHLDVLYQSNPVIYRPHPGELAQITIALWEVENTLSSSCSKTHLIFRSLTPILLEDDLERVTNVLERVIDQQRSDSSLTVFSVDYTEHDERTMTALKDLVDGVVWVEQGGNRELQLEYRRTRTV